MERERALHKRGSTLPTPGQSGSGRQAQSENGLTIDTRATTVSPASAADRGRGRRRGGVPRPGDLVLIGAAALQAAVPPIVAWSTRPLSSYLRGLICVLGWLCFGVTVFWGGCARGRPSPSRRRWVFRGTPAAKVGNPSKNRRQNDQSPTLTARVGIPRRPRPGPAPPAKVGVPRPPPPRRWAIRRKTDARTTNPPPSPRGWAIRGGGRGRRDPAWLRATRRDKRRDVGRQVRMWPSPSTAHFVVVSSAAIGPRAQLLGGDADLGTEADSPPSVKRVEALTMTAAASTSATKRRAAARSSVIASVCPVRSGRCGDRVVDAVHHRD